MACVAPAPCNNVVSLMLLSRRGLITGLVSLVAAPAIVRASSLMPVKAWAPYDIASGGITWVDEIYDVQLAVTRGVNGLIPYFTTDFETFTKAQRS